MSLIAYTDALLKCFHDRRVEPAQRLVGGRFGWAVHKYPIKDGISIQQMMLADFARASVLGKALFQQKSVGDVHFYELQDPKTWGKP